jgi:GSCFA family
MMTIGSCFSDSMGERLLSNKFQTLVNPFGTTYNPHSIHKLIRMIIHNQIPSPETYLEREDIFSNYDFHSSLSEQTRESLEQTLKEKINSIHSFLAKCDFLFITYGTAWVYERKDNCEIVANCHKQPSQLFSKRLMSQAEIEKDFNALLIDLKKLNPNIKVILTLSPVRHLKDTLELNSVSKAIVRSACYSITQKYEDVDYFAAYEIMMDDLRDYRFYSSDMIHPSEDAENYIWDKFADRYFSPEMRTTIHDWQTVKKMIDHKPFHPNSASHQKFLNETLFKLENLKSRINVVYEIAELRKLIH